MDGRGWKCDPGNEIAIQQLKLAKPKEMSAKVYRHLVNTAMIFTTDFPNEARFNRQV
jgi:hypothetical protein